MMSFQILQKNQNDRKGQFNFAIKIARIEKTAEKSYNDLSQLPLINIVSSDNFSLSTQNFHFLQRTIGNQAVGRFIQAKLKIGQPNDKYEQEADRVADAVMRMPEPSVQRQEDEEEEIQIKPLAAQITPLVQRQVEEEEEEPVQTKLITSDIPKIQRQEEPEEEEESIQTKRMSGFSSEATPEIASNISALRGSGGHSLHKSVRDFFEPRFGCDFSNVRLHTDSYAAEMARAMKAHAFTLGRNVGFAAGEYSSNTLSGRKLLAHELTHIVQQSNTPLRGKITDIKRNPANNIIQRAIAIRRPAIDDATSREAKKAIEVAKDLLKNPNLDPTQRNELQNHMKKAEEALSAYRNTMNERSAGMIPTMGTAIEPTAVNPYSAIAVGLILLVAWLISTNPTRSEANRAAAEQLSYSLKNLSEVVTTIGTIMAASIAERHINGAKKIIEEHINKINDPDPYGGPPYIPKWLKDIAKHLKNILKQAKKLKGKKQEEVIKYVKETADSLRELAKEHNIRFDFRLT